ADLDGDGTPDLVADNADGTVTLLRGNGDGTFQTGTQYTAAGPALQMAAVDLNGDGLDDVVTANGGSNFVSVLLNTGPVAHASATALDLGHATVGLHSGSQQVTVTNGGVRSGTVALHPGTLAITGPDADEFSVASNGCDGVSLSPG